MKILLMKTKLSKDKHPTTRHEFKNSIPSLSKYCLNNVIFNFLIFDSLKNLDTLFLHILDTIEHLLHNNILQIQGNRDRGFLLLIIMIKAGENVILYLCRE